MAEWLERGNAQKYLTKNKESEMKVRYGFVSNSSTTSFCIYGAAISSDKADELDSDKELEVHYGDPEADNDGAYVGVSWKRIGDNETGAQFKARIQEAVKKLVGDEAKDLNFCTIEEAYRDG